MRKLILLLTLFFSLVLITKAQVVATFQSGTIKGKITDTIASSPVGFANIVLYRVKDASLAQGAVSSPDGSFIIKKIPEGKYNIVISSVGYLKHKINNVQISADKPEINLGKIVLKPFVSKLSEVTVTSEKAAVEYFLDKKVVNVEKDIASEGGNALDVLRNVPSVTVDADNSINLRGESKVRIQVDGRPSKFSGTTLDQIPASDIESIEIISNPSAKYNPEGKSGIINIKMKKSKDDGFNGTVIVGAGTNDRYNASVNLNYKYNKVNFFLTYLTKTYGSTGLRTKNRITYGWDSINHIYEDGNFYKKNNLNNLKAGIDLYLNPNNTLTLTGQYNNAFRQNNEDINTTKKNINYIITKYYDINNTVPEDDIEYGGTVNYKKTFEKKGKELTADIAYSLNTDNIRTHNTQLMYNPFYVIIDSLAHNTVRDDNNSMASIQFNFVNPLKKEGAKFETGFQGILKNTNNYYHYYNYLAYALEWKNDTMKSNQFIYNQQTFGVYALYANSIGLFSYQGGLRLEQTLSNSEQITTKEKFSHNYLDLFPSLHLTKKLEDKQDIQFSYSRRINRPDRSSLNPFIDYTNPEALHYGNPNLKPEYNNNFELEHLKKWKNTTLVSDIFYRTVKDDIKRIISADSNGVTHTTFANISSGESYGAEVILEHKFMKGFNVSANYSYFRTIINDNSNVYSSITSDNFSWIAKITAKIELPYKINFQLSGFYNGPKVTPQGTTKETYSIDISLRKKVLKNKASVSLRVSDVFNTLKYQSFSEGEGFIINTATKRFTRIAYISFKYKINSKFKKKTAKANESKKEFEEEDVEM